MKCCVEQNGEAYLWIDSLGAKFQKTFLVCLTHKVYKYPLGVFNDLSQSKPCKIL